jgi:hypothetical protein
MRLPRETRLKIWEPLQQAIGLDFFDRSRIITTRITLGTRSRKTFYRAQLYTRAISIQMKVIPVCVNFTSDIE